MPRRSSRGMAQPAPSATASANVSIAILRCRRPKSCVLLQGQRRFDRRLRPAAYRIGLEVLLANPPARAQVIPVARGIVAFDRHRRRAGESARASSAAVTPAWAPQPEPSLTIDGEVADTRQLAARAEIFGDAQRVRGSGRRLSPEVSRRSPRRRWRSSSRNNGSRRRRRAAQCRLASRPRSRAPARR